MRSASKIGIGVVGLLAATACHPAKPVATPPAEDRVSALTPYPAKDWSNRDPSDLGGSNPYAATRAICAGVIHAEPPAADLPTVKQQAALRGCNSEALYFGIGMPADPVKARQCAMIERTKKRDAPFAFFEAEGILTMVYANGRGAARNYDVAIHMACRLDDAAAAMDQRIRTLDEYRRSGWNGDSFSTCDDNTSGVGRGVCADHAGKIAEQRRGERIARLKRDWTPEQSQSFDRLYASLSDYAGVAHVMDCHGGTAHAACTIEGQQADIERFLTRIEALVQGKPLPEDVPSGGPHPAVGGKRWDAHYADGDEGDREWLVANREAAIAARRVFERDLIAFAKATLPHFTSHQVRSMFANI